MKYQELWLELKRHYQVLVDKNKGCICMVCLDNKRILKEMKALEVNLNYFK